MTLVLAASVMLLFEFLLLMAVSAFGFILRSILIVLSSFVVLFSLAMFAIGGKILVRPSLRAVSIEELRRRTECLNRRGKRRPITLPVMIYLCGIDGAGKTTQARLIANSLRSKGLTCAYVWFRWSGFFSYPLLGLARLLGYTKWMAIEGTDIRYHEHYFDKNNAIAQLSAWFFFIDVLFYSVFLIKIPMATHDVLVCDRFVLDGIVDLVCDTKNHKIPKDMVGKLLVSLIPQRSIVLLLDLPEEVAYKRKRDIPNLEYLRSRRQVFLNLANILSVPVLNAAKSPEALHSEIVETYLCRLPQWYARQECIS